MDGSSDAVDEGCGGGSRTARGGAVAANGSAGGKGCVGRGEGQSMVRKAMVEGRESMEVSFVVAGSGAADAVKDLAFADVLLSCLRLLGY